MPTPRAVLRLRPTPRVAQALLSRALSEIALPARSSVGWTASRHFHVVCDLEASDLESEPVCTSRASASIPGVCRGHPSRATCNYWRSMAKRSSAATLSSVACHPRTRGETGAVHGGLGPPFVQLLGLTLAHLSKPLVSGQRRGRVLRRHLRQRCLGVAATASSISAVNSLLGL